MDLNRLSSLFGAPLASFFLILVLCTFAVQRPVSVGFNVPMVRIHRTLQHEFSCDGRFEFFRLTKDGKTWINAAEIPADQVRARVAALMENRAERVVYVIADSELSYGRFMEFLGKIEGATTDLHIVVISGEIRRMFEEPRKLVPPSKISERDQHQLMEQGSISVCDFEFSEN